MNIDSLIEEIERTLAEESRSRQEKQAHERKELEKQRIRDRIDAIVSTTIFGVLTVLLLACAIGMMIGIIQMIFRFR